MMSDRMHVDLPPEAPLYELQSRLFFIQQVAENSLDLPEAQLRGRMRELGQLSKRALQTIEDALKAQERWYNEAGR
jgi:hypothetical protein